MKENYVDFKKLDINPRIIYAAKQCGLLSSEGILYGSSRHCHPSRQLSPSNHSALVAAVAALHCPAHISCYDLLQQQCKSSTTVAKTAFCNNNGRLFSNMQDATFGAAPKRSKTQHFKNNSSISVFHEKDTHALSSNTKKKKSNSIQEINVASKNCISSTKQHSSDSSINIEQASAESMQQSLARSQKCAGAELLLTTNPVPESSKHLPSQPCFTSSPSHSNSLLKCPISAPIVQCSNPSLQCSVPSSPCPTPSPCPAPSSPCPAPILPYPTLSSQNPAPTLPCPAPSSPCPAPLSQCPVPLHCPASSSQCTNPSPQHPTSQCTTVLLQHPSPSPQCPVPFPQCTTSSPKCPAPPTQCTTPSPQCPGPMFRCPKLASDLKGLFAPGSLVEVCGESGSGKTQLALSLALNTVLPRKTGGLASKVAYLCTEGQFPSSRLQQMVAAVNRCGSAVVQHTAVADSVMVQHIPDLLSLSNSIRYQLPALLQRTRPQVALVLLDSVAAPFRAEAGDWPWTERQARLHHLGHALRQLATEHHCSVLVINQVTARYGLPDLYGQADADEVMPALGLAWANLVTSRLMLARTAPSTCSQLEAEEGAPQPRSMQLLFCPWLPRHRIPFVVAAEGVLAAPDGSSRP